MKILILHNYYQHPGGEDAVFEQETHLLSQTNEVKTVKLYNRKGLKGILQYLFYPWNIFASKHILKQIETFKPDIVHIHNTHYAVGPHVFRRLARNKIPTVQTLHNFRILDPSATLFHNGNVFTDTISQEFPWRSVRQKVLDGSLLKTFLTAITYYIHKKAGTWQRVQFLVFSEFMKELLLKSSLRLDPEQINIKPNFVFPMEHQENVEREQYFIYIGRLSIEKGIMLMLQAFSNTRLELRIYGSGPLQDTVEQYSNTQPNIRYYGFQEKSVLYKALRRSQALIIPSIWFEGMPMTVLDAFATGTPVIANSIGILSEMIKDGETGLHFDTNNTNSLNQTLEKWQTLSSQHKLLMSENCQKEYRESYSPQKNLILLQNIYTETITRNNEYHHIR